MAREVFYILLSFSAIAIVNIAYAENIRQKLFDPKNGVCSVDQFQCSSGECIRRDLYCNGRRDCSDNSDEQYCNTNSNCPSNIPLFRCSVRGTLQTTTPDYSYYMRSTPTPYYFKCIPAAWKCDGRKDCPNGEDETNCDKDGSVNAASITRSRQKALNWIHQQRKQENPTRKWGSEVSRLAIALHLANDTLFRNNDNIRNEIAYEVTLGLFNKLSQKTMKDVSDTELASYVNAMLVTCINPRRFYMLDLVTELRKKVITQNYTNPSVILALCNAGDQVTDKDVENLLEAFGKARGHFWTDTQALILLALSCAAVQPHGVFDAAELKDMTMELKKRQYRNGTVENLKTTALVMQALFASESEPDEDNFDEEKAIKQILLSQLADGSFGSTVNTYYVLPVLNYRTLANITSSHCKEAPKDEKDGFEDLLNQVGPKTQVQYSLWIGNDRTVERTLTLNVPLNTSFYRLMEFAADVDFRFKFEYSMRNDKPYIYSISGIQDDPESGLFWFPFQVNGEMTSNLTAITKSPADVLVGKQHLVFWYKRGDWTE